MKILPDNKLGSSEKRRSFLKQVAGTSVAVPLAGVGLAAAQSSASGQVTQPSAQAGDLTVGYISLSGEEAAFVEHMVNVMCPADNFTPNGVDCGLAFYIDRQLSGSFGKGWKKYSKGPWATAPATFGDQSPLTPEEQFKAGVAAANEACRSLFAGKAFDQLSAAQADGFLKEIAAGKVSTPGGRVALATWFNRLVYKLFNEACFADPIYGGNKDKVFWRLVGYPGLPATYGNDVVEFRGKPYPGSKNPKSIADFS